MISKATEDARLRAEKIAENSGGSLGDLNKADMGVFQITGQTAGKITAGVVPTIPVTKIKQPQ